MIGDLGRYHMHINTAIRRIDTIEIGKFRKCMTSYRASCYNLMIEKGRHYDLLLEDRLCVYCET